MAVALLGTLPTQQREALVLREWLGLSAIETASILESTPQGVDALVYRARKSLVGLADAIVDLVSTGNTLRANDLIEVERIMDISSRLIVNQAALKLKREPIRRIIDAFGAVVGAPGQTSA